MGSALSRQAGALVSGRLCQMSARSCVARRMPPGRPRAGSPHPPLSLPTDGQTGSGKTYTMLGGEEEAGEAGGHQAAAAGDARGLIQRVFEHLFARMVERGGKHLLECSFLEIYNEVGAGCRAGGWGPAVLLEEDVQGYRGGGPPGEAWRRVRPMFCLLLLLLLAPALPTAALPFTPQTITDLLDPSRTNLAVRWGQEAGGRGLEVGWMCPDLRLPAGAAPALANRPCLALPLEHARRCGRTWRGSTWQTCPAGRCTAVRAGTAGGD